MAPKIPGHSAYYSKFLLLLCLIIPIYLIFLATLVTTKKGLGKD